MKLNNKYYILRHGEAVSNIKGFVSSWPEKSENPLTEAGVEQAKQVAKKILSENIDLIFSSDILRAKQTAQIIAGQLKKEVKFDERLREIDFGIFNSKPIADFVGHFANKEKRIKEKAPHGESYEDILKRIESFLENIEKTYSNKKILIVSHQAPLFILEGIFLGYSLEESVEFFTDDKLLSNCELKQFE
jgi:broad specificity phosphatase PhoE